MKKILIFCAFVVDAFLINACYSLGDRLYYQSEFRLYADEVHGIDLKYEDKSYLVIHLQGCNSCIDKSFKLLSDYMATGQDNLNVIFVGDYLEYTHEVLYSIERCKDYFDYYIDEGQEIFRYQTGFAYPIFISVKNGRFKKYTELTEKTANDIYRLLNIS